MHHFPVDAFEEHFSEGRSLDNDAYIMLIGHGDKHLKANNQRGEKEEMLQLHLLHVLQKDQALVEKKTVDTSNHHFCLS